MALTRFINPLHFDFVLPRITNIAFKHSKPDPSGSDDEVETPDGRMGISVVETECACDGDAPDDCMCAHIHAHDSHRFPEPAVYWTFDPGILQPRAEDDPKWDVEVLGTPSDAGDPCHRNIHGFNDKRANKIFKRHANVDEMMICTDGVAEPFSWDRIRELQVA